MIQQHFIIKWEGYPVMTLNSISDVQEMILAIAQEKTYYNFYQEIQCGKMDFQRYINYIDFCREEENHQWNDAGIVGLETWYGYDLLKSVENYSIGTIIHLD